MAPANIDLSGRAALVTGAGVGIGCAVAKAGALLDINGGRFLR